VERSAERGREGIGEEGEEGKGGKNHPNKKTGYGAGWRERGRREGMEERRDFVGQSPTFPSQNPLKYALRPKLRRWYR